MYVVGFGMGRGARNIDHLALVENVLHMNAITLHFFSMNFRGDVKNCSFSNLGEQEVSETVIVIHI